MYDGRVNKKSGILVVNLPSIHCTYYTATHSEEKERVYPENTSWTNINTRNEYESMYPYMPVRVIDNLLKNDTKISVVPWEKIVSAPDTLAFLIDATHKDKADCNYDLLRLMRRSNS